MFEFEGMHAHGYQPDSHNYLQSDAIAKHKTHDIPGNAAEAKTYVKYIYMVTDSETRVQYATPLKKLLFWARLDFLCEAGCFLH